MKRTKKIQKDTFRKKWRSYRVASVTLAISSAFILPGCEQTDTTVSMYQNANDCSAANPSMSSQCTTAYNNALKEAEKIAPKYATKEDCSAKFGKDQCIPSIEQSTQSTQENSSWMPLMAGYMIGRMLNESTGFAQQPLFSSRSPANASTPHFVDANGKSYGNATYGRTITVPKTDLEHKHITTHTITRGGFGENAAKQNSMQTRSTRTSSSFRSMGG